MKIKPIQNSIHLPLKRYSDKKETGFTLFEMLLTVLLALMVITLSFGSLYYSSKGSRDARIKTNLDFELMKAYAQIRQQIINLYKSPFQDVSLKGRKGKEQKRDEIMFYSSSPVFGKGVIEAAYAIRMDGERPYLVYREFPYTRKIEFKEDLSTTIGATEEDYEIDEVKWRKVSDAITGITFEYFKMDRGYEEWDDKNLPERIEVSLWYETKDTPLCFSFSIIPAVLTPSD